MYSTKRLAKRSIIGTRVAAPWPGGIFYPGIIAGVDENIASYTICFDDGYTRVYRDTEIVGPGFRGIASVHLKFGQKVFFTNNGREMIGLVQKHRKPTHEVLIKMEDDSETMIQRKRDEVRLLESRKSPRLADHETNYLKLADMNPTSDAKRRAVSHCIDVPSAKSPKVEKEPLMDDVMAAMVLTSLSASSPMATDNSSAPYSPASLTWGTTTDSLLGNASYSPSSSGHFSWPDFHSRGTPSPTSSTSDIESNAAYGLSCPETGATNGFVFGPPSIDEGIDMSEVGALCTIDNNPVQKPKIGPVRTVYKCTWPGCSKTSQIERVIEKHVRSQHLRTKKDHNSNDHEEEFYYTEIEMSSVDTISDMFANMNTSTCTSPYELPDARRRMQARLDNRRFSHFRRHIRPPTSPPKQVDSFHHQIAPRLTSYNTASSFTKQPLPKPTSTSRPPGALHLPTIILPRLGKARNAVSCTAWSARICGAHSVGGRRRVFAFRLKRRTKRDTTEHSGPEHKP